MMEEWITRKSPEYKEIQEKALAALDQIEAMIETLPSHLNAETYLTSEEVRNLFVNPYQRSHIRLLQKVRRS